MSIGIGGQTVEQALSKLSDQSQSQQAISLAEYQQRLAKAQRLMADENIDILYLNAGTNLHYFTGTQWYPSERLVGALLFQSGEIFYVAPHFEVDTLASFTQIEAPILPWHEDESPYQLIAAKIADSKLEQPTIGIDESSAFFISNGIQQAMPDAKLVDAKPITAGCRACKSKAELDLLQLAKNMTLQVHQATASILRPGITTQEVTEFINQAHRRVGAKGSSFCIVLFGQDTAFPHGVKTPKALEEGDMVLIDTGCLVQGYNSDITRTYVFGEATERQRQMWQHEKNAQQAAFEAARPGVPCAEVDIAARDYLQSQGLGPDYQLPGVPHRTGHGVGLDIHEWPYLVRSDKTPLAPGMCFSNEPMLVVPGEFGVRLEDHFYIAEDGPRWFTQPSHSIDDPFGLAVE